jgi:hypothetical protein
LTLVLKPLTRYPNHRWVRDWLMHRALEKLVQEGGSSLFVSILRGRTCGLHCVDGNRRKVAGYYQATHGALYPFQSYGPIHTSSWNQDCVSEKLYLNAEKLFIHSPAGMLDKSLKLLRPFFVNLVGNAGLFPKLIKLVLKVLVHPRLLEAR